MMMRGIGIDALDAESIAEVKASVEAEDACAEDEVEQTDDDNFRVVAIGDVTLSGAINGKVVSYVLTPERQAIIDAHASECLTKTYVEIIAKYEAADDLE
ncbi:MAG: hypothetical protein WCI73_08495 [Phycisphaerae bacterium]